MVCEGGIALIHYANSISILHAAANISRLAFMSMCENLYCNCGGCWVFEFSNFNSTRSDMLL